MYISNISQIFFKALYFKNILILLKKSTQIKKNRKNSYISKKINVLKKKKIKKLQLQKIFYKKFYFLQKKRLLKENRLQLRFLYLFIKRKAKRTQYLNFSRKTFFFCKPFLKNLKIKMRIKLQKKITEKNWGKLFLQFNFSYNSSIYNKFFQKFIYHQTHLFGQNFFKNMRILFKYRNQKKFAIAYYQKNNRVLTLINKFYTRSTKIFFSPFFLSINSFLALNKFFEKYNFSYALVQKNSKKKAKDFVGCLIFQSKFFLIVTFLRNFFMQKNYNISKFMLKSSTLQNYIWFLGHNIFYKQAHNFQQYKQILVNATFQKIYKKILHNTSFKILL